jgi:hypothetical protein
VKIAEKKEKMKSKTSFLFKLGVFLIILSFLKWLAGFYVPFLPYPDKIKLAIITAIFIAAEITFWLGVFLVGEETYKKYKKYLSPRNWFRKPPAIKLPEEAGERKKSRKKE